MVVVSLDSGHVVEGDLNPSSDTPTHWALYRAFAEIGGIVHTHSLYGMAWAQAGCDIPAQRTTHADYFYGAIPCTRKMTPDEIAGEYELETGNAIIERFNEINPTHFLGVLVASHAPFAWGINPDKAVENAVVLENIAHLASETLHVRADVKIIQQELLDKHFLHKHGASAYYG